MRLRASDLTAIFEVYMLAVVLGSLKNALDTAGPWYHGTATFWAYATTFVGSLVLVSVMALAAVVLVRPRGFEEALQTLSSERPRPAANPSPASGDEEMKENLEFLMHAAASRGHPPGVPAAVEETLEVTAVQAPAEAAVPRPRRAQRILPALLGPTITATIFAGISAALLPGSDGFLQTLFTFNTFIIVVFAYGWAGLLGYAMASLFLAASEV